MQDLQLNAAERLEARCNECSLRLRGDFSQLVVIGKDNFLTLEGRVETLRLEGEHNTVECRDGPSQVILRGSGQRVRISERPGRQRPHVQVEGSDQAVTYRPWQPSGKADSTAAGPSRDTGPTGR